MIILGLTDIHGDISPVESMADELAAADVVLISGDLTNFGRDKAARYAIDALRKYSKAVLAVSGNCDHPEVEEYLRERGVSLHRRGVVVGGIGFMGVGGSLPCPSTTPNEYTEDHLTRHLAEAHAQLPAGVPFVLVTHQPPAHTKNDLASNGEHVGSYALRRFITQQQPLLCCTGHIHESIGIDTIGITKVVNPGPFRLRRYMYARVTRSGIEALEIRSLIRTPEPEEQPA
jgi:Icc-related predicted phosphoesterase